MSDGLAQDEALRARFLREAQAAGSLQHPNVVTIYDFGETDGHLFIAMEFVQGADLEHLLRHNAPLSLAAKLDIIVDVLNGLYYAHRRGIVHRDIKPANIRVDEEGHARIMDFGVARLATSDMTKSGIMMGTPNYMAPEQISGGNITAAVDIFSVGALLYELLTHVKPFEGDTMHNVLFKIVTDSPPDVRDIKPDLPEALSAIVKKAIAKEPSERFGTASEMANALSTVRATLGPARISKTLAQRVSARSDIDKSLRERRDAHARAISMRRWRMVAGVLTGIAALATINYFIVRGRPDGTLPAAGVTTAGAPTDTLRSMVSQPPPRGATRDSVGSAADLAKAWQKATLRPEGAEQRAGATPSRPTTKSVAPARDVARGRATADTSRTTATSTQTSTPAQNTPAQSPPSQAVVVPSQVNPSPPVTAPAETTRPAAPTPAEPENPRPAIASVVSNYARAIGTRQVDEIRRVYAEMTQPQQSAWETFFSSVRTMTAAFDISSIDVRGNTAVARLSGVYEYVTRTGRSERRVVSLEATLVRDGERWRLQTIR
jgi:hypothetical protein